MKRVLVATTVVPRIHWKLNGPVPVTPTENCAACPSLTFTLAGCAEMMGALAELPDTHSDQPGVLSMMPGTD